MTPAPLFRRALSGYQVTPDSTDHYDLLPDIIRDMHEVSDTVTARGVATIQRDPNPFAHLAAKIFGFPKAGVDIPVHVTFQRRGDQERLTPDFGGETFTTHFKDHPAPGHMTEIFGPLWFVIECPCTAEGITMHIRGVRLWGWLPLPTIFVPRIMATERVVDGKYQFDVDIHLPLIGRVIWYKGTLIQIKDNTRHTSL